MPRGAGSSLPTPHWHDFADLSAPLLYEVLRFRQAIFVVEQDCPYPDLDGLDRQAHHLLLHLADPIQHAAPTTGVIPAKAGIHGPTAPAADWWVPAFAGTTTRWVSNVRFAPLDGALAGYLRLIPYPQEHRIAIGRVSVVASYRRHGLARLLMAEALARCRRQYPDHAVTLSAQTYLTGFYESLGFRATSGSYDDYGLPHIDMRLSGT